MCENCQEKKDYGKTLNLPKTDFPMRGNLPENEPKIFDEILKDGLYEKMLKKNEGKEPFVLHDGPPYANGEIHVGHALNKTLKDTVVMKPVVVEVVEPCALKLRVEHTLKVVVGADFRSRHLVCHRVAIARAP